MMLQLSPEVETLVRQNAQNEGLTERKYVSRLVKETEIVPAPVSKDGSHMLDAPVNATNALFAQWDKEDAAMTNEDRRNEDRFWCEFSDGIDQNRAVAPAL